MVCHLFNKWICEVITFNPCGQFRHYRTSLRWRTSCGATTNSWVATRCYLNCSVFPTLYFLKMTQRRDFSSVKVYASWERRGNSPQSRPPPLLRPTACKFGGFLKPHSCSFVGTQNSLKNYWTEIINGNNCIQWSLGGAESTASLALCPGAGMCWLPGTRVRHSQSTATQESSSEPRGPGCLSRLHY